MVQEIKFPAIHNDATKRLIRMLQLSCSSSHGHEATISCCNPRKDILESRIEARSWAPPPQVDFPSANQTLQDSISAPMMEAWREFVRWFREILRFWDDNIPTRPCYFGRYSGHLHLLSLITCFVELDAVLAHALYIIGLPQPFSPPFCVPVPHC